MMPPSNNFHLATSPYPTGGPVDLFNDNALMVRAVDVETARGQGWQYRPVTLLGPQCNNPVSEDPGDKRILKGYPWALAMLKPVDRFKMLWSFKRDAMSNGQGEEARSTHLRTRSIKKITDWATLDSKLREIKDRQTSIFQLTSSGHLGKGGYLLHQSSRINNEDKTFPEVICHLNFDLMHSGYLLDFAREATFGRIADMMKSILVLELGGDVEEGDVSDAEEFPQPVKLSVYDSARNKLFPPVELRRNDIETIMANAKLLAQYASAVGQGCSLFNLLAQSGCDRFLKLLGNIPESVKAVAGLRDCVDLETLSTIIQQLDAIQLPVFQAVLDAAKSNNINLPESLMTDLLDSHVFRVPEALFFLHKYKFTLQELPVDRTRLREIKSAFSIQEVICRELLKHNFFVPILISPFHLILYNPLLACLLVAHGSRVYIEKHFRGHLKFALQILMAARYFGQVNLLTSEEVRIICHEILWAMFCYRQFDPWYIPPEDRTGKSASVDTVRSEFDDMVCRLKSFFASQPESRGADWVSKQCRELLGAEIYNQFYLDKKADGQMLRDYLERGLSPQRYSDARLLEHLRNLSVLPTPSNSLLKGSIYLSDLSHVVNSQAVFNSVNKESGHNDWLSELLTSAPTFLPDEIQRIGRYRATIREVGLHYYQYPHPTRATIILANGPQPYYREFHGLDHAMRTQLATEFLLDDRVLPCFHKPFEELLRKHPALQELLPIAELYHDAVAEDEYKDVEELRAAELFQRDMATLHEYPDQLISLVASALRNKNSNKMQSVTAPFTSDNQCSEEELLLRQVLRFGDIVDILRVIPPRDDFPGIRLTPGSGKPVNNDYFNPEAIELLTVVDNPDFTLLVQASLVGFRHLGCITGGWHYNKANLLSDKYHLVVDNHQRRLMIEQAAEPYQCMHQSLDDLVRLVIAKRAGIEICRDEHPKRSGNPGVPDCWNSTIGFGGAYQKLHNEQELRQIALSPEMTLSEKIIVAADDPDLEKFLSHATSEALGKERFRLQHKGILPDIGTPSQSDLEFMFKKPDCKGARIMAEREIRVKRAKHEGYSFYRMVPARKRRCIRHDTLKQQ
ncbi:hypothetical protein [Endozoicomonas sp. YOMI1]|uniref:hypothetical protein n=1 Tax=Endozoicomonas sp. YOMI1 TaxID=2828739 RepID=UPI0021486605|nr:hypothetical protein [Endozoicomonas sp. YOMI1]